MGITIFFLLCAAAVAFLLYALVHFVEDSRRSGPARRKLLQKPWRQPAVYQGRRRPEKIILFRQVSTPRQLAKNS